MALPYKSFITFDLGFMTFSAFGLFFFLTLIVSIVVSQWAARKKKLSPEHTLGVLICIFMGAVIGGRLFYAIEEWQYFIANPFEILLFWKGGTSFIGGFVGATIISYFYVRINKLNFWKYAGIAAITGAIAHAVGRVGCILGDGGHIGKITTMPWGVIVEGQLRHMTALYDLVAEVIIFGILIYLMRKKSFDELLFSIYILLYTSQRFFTDFLRVEPTYYGLNITQYTCIILFFVFGFILLKKTGYGKKLLTSFGYH
ncbi:prolipoprotein diacylglyceryl transferase [Candidatus Woesearchaeota archaeon]|nr:prolipoprotein diacylglyceryl transferase [Candidatus Woesearchaeota archaeon]